MINQDAIATACRENDEQVQAIGGLTQLLADHDVDGPGLANVAQQRALRVAMMLDDQDPTKLTSTEPITIELSEEIHGLMPFLASLFLDGFMAGRRTVDT